MVPRQPPSPPSSSKSVLRRGDHRSPGRALPISRRLRTIRSGRNGSSARRKRRIDHPVDTFLASSDAESDHDLGGQDSPDLARYEKVFRGQMPRLLQDIRKDLQSLPPRPRYALSSRRRLGQRSNRLLHLACPFYRSNANRYQSCLLQYSLQTIKDVIRHLQRHHTKPPHCPMCYTSFETYLARDEHILVRTCKMLDSGDVDGINEYQKAQLDKRDRPSRGVTTRWNRIYTIVFSESDQPGSPYLNQGRERSVSMARDYWKHKGSHFLAQYVKCHRQIRENLQNEDEDENEALEAFSRLTLTQLLTGIYETDAVEDGVQGGVQ